MDDSSRGGRHVPAAGVRLRALEKRYDAVVALHPTDLDVAPGELVVLVGPSGCGKSTILRLVAGLDDPTGGEVFIGDRAVAGVEPADRDVAMVFQSYALYPHKTVRENLAFGLRMRGLPHDEVARKVAWAASVLGLDDLMERRPAQLSGGQKQRVAFGRAMVREPQVFLFDEPLSNLDARLRADMRREIADLHDRLGATMVYVTHDQVEAMTLGERIAVLRDGRLQQFAAPLEIYRRPANLYVASFIGTPAINLLEGHLSPGEAAAFRAGATAAAPALTLPVTRGAFTGPAVLGVRPEASTLLGPDDPAADFVADVHRVEPLGNESLVHVDGPAGRSWVVRAAADWPGRSGDRVGVRIDRASAHLFDATSERRLEQALSNAPRRPGDRPC
ncbi:MAG: ABC transporter ATP-binding protein [Acidobacteria bacterium]|nr:ABC transporter ATP-binding protein [Acidobacteriota bacterium]